MAEPVRLTSEERCRKAFEEWYGNGVEVDIPTLALYGQNAWNGWEACWRYLERNAFSEFIEK